MTATVLVLQHPDIASCDLSGLPSADLVSATVARIKVDAGFSLSEQAAAALAAQQIDYAVLPDRNFADLGLIVSDMDSTLITIECIDEIAAGVGRCEQSKHLVDDRRRLVTTAQPCLALLRRQLPGGVEQRFDGLPVGGRGHGPLHPRDSRQHGVRGAPG